MTGLTPKAYAAAHRGKRVRAGLEAGGTVTEALYDAGYGSNGRFYAEADKVLGMTPTRFKAGGAGTEIRFAIGQCSLGAIGVACSERGVCAIELGDDPDALARRLQDRFPHATWVGGDAEFERQVAAVVGFVEAPQLGLALPLDVRGTAFQQRVWQALQAIPRGSDRELRRDRRASRCAERIARGGAGLRRKPAGGRDPVPSRRSQRRRAVGLPLGRRAQARAAGARGGRMNARDTGVVGAHDSAIDDRIAAIDWAAVGSDLDAQGAAVIEQLLPPDECRELAALYPRDDRFRSTVTMARHGFGRGEYRYFRYPLPPLIAGLRAALYPHLVPVANRWHEAMGIETRFPDRLADFTARCHAAGQNRPTPLLLRYGEGDYNCLHQDLYGDHVFPLQVVVLLSEPGRDFTGGEFVMTEQRPRMQSRPLVLPLDLGDAAVIAVHHRPVQGTRGTYRVNLRHGVSRIRSGQRTTAGIIFHDAT